MKKLILLAAVAGAILWLGMGNKPAPGTVEDEEASMADSYNNVKSKAEGVSTTLKEADERRRQQVD
jgi:hypothetical protein